MNESKNERTGISGRKRKASAMVVEVDSKKRHDGDDGGDAGDDDDVMVLE